MLFIEWILSNVWPHSGWQCYESWVQMLGNNRAAGTHSALQSTWGWCRPAQRWTDEPQYFPVCLSIIAYSMSALAFMVLITQSSQFIRLHLWKMKIMYPRLLFFTEYCLRKTNAITIFQWRQWMLTVNVVLSESEVRLSSLLVDCVTFSNFRNVMSGQLHNRFRSHGERESKNQSL